MRKVGTKCNNNEKYLYAQKIEWKLKHYYRMVSVVEQSLVRMKP